MTKKEALEFLELSESSLSTDLKIALADKLVYFENLIEKSSSDFLRRVYSQKIAKIKEIEKESATWEPLKTVSDHIPAQVEEEEANSGDIDPSFTVPIIISSGSKQFKRKSIESGPAGWLVRHTENQASKTFPLLPGKNFIGRKSKPSLSLFTVIDEDPYVSRVHAVIYVEDADPYDFYIADAASDNDGNASKNGTYVNGDEMRITKKVRLRENDTIQVGLTKLILKYNKNTIKKIVLEVEQSDYMNTVAIDVS